MGFSPLADMRQAIPQRGRSSSRGSKIQGVTWHHQYGVDVHSEAWNPSREVSANYWIKNDGTIIPHIDELRRAWTTGHRNYPAGAASDHRNITMEISNSPEGMRSGTHAISAAARRSAVALTADIFTRHKLGRVRRGLHGGVAVHRDFVPTECPGNYIMENLGSMIAEAERIRKGGDDMTPEQASQLGAVYSALFGARNLTGRADPVSWVDIDGSAQKSNYGVLSVIIHNQALIARLAGQNAALLKAIEQLSSGGGSIDMAVLERAAESGAREALSGLTLKAEAQ